MPTSIYSRLAIHVSRLLIHVCIKFDIECFQDTIPF